MIRKIINSKNKAIELNAQIADNFLIKAFGLMFRTSLKENEGMFFVFSKEGIYHFWMFCTFIPLEAIFIDESGLVVEILQMKPCKGLSCPQYTPKNKAKYVLEVNSGFCAKNSVIPGKSKLIIQ